MCKTAPSASPDTDCDFDGLDRLKTYKSYAASQVEKSATYTYDALDRPTREVEDHGSGASAAPTNTTTFNYLGLTDQLTSETHSYSDNSANRTRDYSYDPYGNRVEMTYQKAGDAGKEFYYGFDPQGSISQLIDDAGSVQASYGYTAYGDNDPSLSDERSPDDGAGTGCDKPSTDTTGDNACKEAANPYRYTDKRFDPGSGSLDMGARRFSPSVGRFAQEDVLNDALGDLGLSADPLSGNRYALAGGNPVNFVEDDGHMLDVGGMGGASGADARNHYRRARVRAWSRQHQPNRCYGEMACGGADQLARGDRYVANRISAAKRALPSGGDPLAAIQKQAKRSSAFYADVANETGSPFIKGLATLGGSLSELGTKEHMGEAAMAVAPGPEKLVRGAKLIETADRALAPAKRATGVTVLGHDPAYRNLANKMGARYFDVPDQAWRRMSDADKWTANKKFLDRTIARGDRIVLATRVGEMRSDIGYFAGELRYLASRGYRLNADGTQLVRP